MRCIERSEPISRMSSPYAYEAAIFKQLPRRGHSRKRPAAVLAPRVRGIARIVHSRIEPELLDHFGPESIRIVAFVDPDGHGNLIVRSGDQKSKPVPLNGEVGSIVLTALRSDAASRGRAASRRQ